MQEKAAQMVAMSISIAKIAQECNVLPRQIYRWCERPAVQKRLDYWRALANTKAEAKQEELATTQADLAKRTLEAAQMAVEKLIGLLETSDSKIKVAAAHEVLDFHKSLAGGGSEKGADVQAFLASVIAGKFGDQKIPLGATGEVPVQFKTVLRNTAEAG